jgi:hypothetical protein
MSRPRTAAGLAALTALAGIWLLLALSTLPIPDLVTPQPIYLTGRLVSMLTG